MVSPSVYERYRSDGTGEVHGGRTPSHHLGDIMNGKTTILLSGLVAVLMVTCAVPFMASEDSDALIHDSNMALNSDRAVIYVTSGSDHSFTFTAATTDGNTGSIAWKLNDIGDGSNNVSFDDSTSTYTASGSSATVYGKVAGSIEVEAYVVGDEANHCASAVVVVYPSPSTTTSVFHFFFQIDPAAYTYVYNASLIETESGEAILPSGYSMSDFNTGFWVTVDNSVAQLTTFNALTAIQWYMTTNGWDNTFSNYGWIEDLLGLSSYSGNGGVWYYWAQYHATGNGSSATWAFNNTTLEFITTAGESYIGMIFWGSPNANTMPAFPGYPTA